jgi:ABC-2 type transport system permease protein
MTVRDRAFRRYTGPVTPRRWRFLVLWRYARRELFASRRVTALYALSFAPILIAATVIYLRHNLPALEAMQIDAAALVPVDGVFFLVLLRVQVVFAFLLTAFVGPGLVSPDLANNGLPLYLCRPFSRAEYVLGKMTALVVLTSSMTWLPLLLLVAIQAGLEPGWLAAHDHVAWGLFAGSWTAILLLALLALALSAWIKWQMLAGAMTVAFVLVAGGVAEFVNGIFRTRWGDLLSPGKLVFGLWERMLQDPGAQYGLQVPALAAWLALGLFGALCLLVLHVKLRAYEVVR